MSVRYHPADVPVTDLDDPDDDAVFQERDTSFLNDLDYETPGFFGRIRDYFNRLEKVEEYEMTNVSESAEGSESAGSDLSEPESKWPRSQKAALIFSAIVMAIFLFGVGAFVDDAGPPKPTFSNSTHVFYPTTIVVSLDGFHPHYISAETTPSLHQMLLNDYCAPYMTPSFPSLTFPNHWTLVTGLYPLEHGIVGNTFYDPKLKKQFVNTGKLGLDPAFWHGGEPVWATAQRQFVKLAVHMWPGSEVLLHEPAIFDRYNGSEPLLAKVERITGWLDVEDVNKRPELILAYVPTVDLFGHKFGILGPEMVLALRYVDDFVANLELELKRRHLDDIVNLIVLSDHGMAPTDKLRVLFLDDVVDLAQIEHIDGWPLFGLRPKGDVAGVHQQIAGNIEKLGQSGNFKVYLKEELPREWHFGPGHAFDYRLAPLWIVPAVGYAITTHEKLKEGEEYAPKGVHGYNNTEVLMRALFVGRGPYFRLKLGQAARVQPFANTEVYGMICESLGIEPAPNNGTGAALKRLLPKNWRDPLLYPGLPFAVAHMVQNATYDLLWRKAVRERPTTVSVSTNRHPVESLKQAELARPSVLVALPKPSDFVTPRPTIVEQLTSLVGDVWDSATGLIGGLMGGHEDRL